MTKKIVYQSPPAEVIEAYVRDICGKLGQTDEAFNCSEVVYGFAQFVKVISDIKVRVLNDRDDVLDEDPGS